MEQVSTIGLNIAKHVFQAYGADAVGQVRFRRCHANEATRVLRCAGTLRRRDGSLHRFALLGSRDQ
jgi:hypothetical protein